MKRDAALKLTKEAFESSSQFVDSNYRGDWDYSIKAFRNEHASGSKYLSPEYQHRSRIFRPKTRSIIRKNEAAAAAALANNDAIDLKGANPDDLRAVAGAEAMKAVLSHRLATAIPTFEICMGGVQDAQTQGVVVSYQYWEHEVKNGKKVKDKPCIDIRPIENMRLDGGASWLDPIGTSPYLFDILPMYVCNVKGMMNTVDQKTGQPKWKKFDDKVIAKAKPELIDSTRMARFGKQQDPHQEDQKISAFDIVWVFRVFMRDENGDDFTYYSLGTEELLTDPKPVREVYHHLAEGERPYVMGYAILETHKVFKTSVPVLVKPLQQETNDLRNQRLDNVKFVLNKRWIVARGRQVDVQSLVRNVPGGVTLATDPKNDVQESNWPDVTSSSFVEEDRINADLDDVAGNFSPSTKVANNAVNDTVGGSKMAYMGAGLMTDYLLRTIIETWWEKALRQLVKLEAAYEDDEVILAICAQKARLFPKYGISRITDDLLEQDMLLTVNIGMGATNPNERFQKAMMFFGAANNLIATAPAGSRVMEQIKELASHAGFRDGSRFYSEQQDPRIAKLMQMVQQLQQALQGKQMDLQATAQIEAGKSASNERVKLAQLEVDKGRISGDLQIRQAELALQGEKLALERLQIQIEAAIASKEHQLRVQDLGSKVEESRLKLEAENKKIMGMAIKIAADIEKAQIELQTAKAEQLNAPKREQAAEESSKHTKAIAEGLESLRGELARLEESRKSDNDSITKGLGAMVGVMMAPKKKPKSIRMSKKDGRKTDAVAIDYDDGSSEELKVA